MTKKAYYLSTNTKYPLGYIIKNPFLLGLLSALSTVVFANLLENILKTEDTMNGHEIDFHSSMELIGTAVIIPLIETLVFQTFIILVTFIITNSKIINIAVSSAIFSASHVGNTTSFPIILEGFSLAMIPGSIFAYISFKNIYEYQLKSSIIYTWAAHSTHNTSILLLYAYEVFSP